MSHFWESGVREFDFKYCNQLTGITNIIWFAVYHLHPFAHLHHLPGWVPRCFPTFWKPESALPKESWQAYFFRLSLRRPAGCSTLKSRARFYVLKGSDGKVFPFTRPTIDAWHFLAVCTDFHRIFDFSSNDAGWSKQQAAWNDAMWAMAALWFCAEGSASFSLKPGEEYKFCWCLVVGRELQRIVVSRPAQMKTPPFLKMWRITLGWTWVGLYP